MPCYVPLFLTSHLIQHKQRLFFYLKLLTLFLSSFCLAMLWFSSAKAACRSVDLKVAYQRVNFTGTWVKAIAVNQHIPGPTLHFKEGDHVCLNVYNHLDKGTAIHWHGLLVPWQMDGVEHVSQAPIPPGGVFHYQFTLKQAGTYWYHAHAGLQEQQGLYGAIVIDPIAPSPYHYNKDIVVILSDWINTDPEQVFANLKKTGDYYSPNLPLQPSLSRFIRDYRATKTPEARQKLVSDYKMMQHMRMSIYDISDVAYDTFLMNGQTPNHPWQTLVKIGDVVRLRFIDAGASTFFRVKIPHTPLQVVHVQGNDVKPYTVDSLTIAPAETYDVLIKIQKKAPYLIYAESADAKGAAVGALVTQPQQAVSYQHIPPFPTPEPVTMGAMMMPGMAQSAHHSMSMTSAAPMAMGTHETDPSMQDMSHETSMSSMTMPSAAALHTMTPVPLKKNHEPHQAMLENMKMDTAMMMKMPSHAATSSMTPHGADTEPTAAGTKYQDLIAAVKTNDPTKPVQIIKMVLSGYMERYIWFINGLPEYKAKPILIEPGKRYRIIFINDSMMHHPMHIHGHWFILRNGHGAYDPLLHTVDVPPGATVTVDFDANASGQWFFHCHNLYHMMAGMSRVFRYTTFAKEPNSMAHLAGQPEGRNEPSYDDMMAGQHPQTMLMQKDLVVHQPGLYVANYLDIGADPFQNDQKLSWKAFVGGDDNKFELYSEDAEIQKGTIENADIDLFYWHLINQFWAVTAGANYVYRPAQTPYWQPGIGLEGLMPYFIDTTVRAYYHNGSAKLDVQLSRDTQITNRFFIRTGLRGILATKTVVTDEVGQGFNQVRYILRPFYQLTPRVALFTEYEHEQDYGALKTIRRQEGESSHANTFTLGVSWLF